MGEVKFVLMEKNGEQLEVHPNVVEAHQQVGWVVVEKKEKPSDPKPAPELKPEKE